jgi:hypothetical protein
LFGCLTVWGDRETGATGATEAIGATYAIGATDAIGATYAIGATDVAPLRERPFLVPDNRASAQWRQ